MSAIDEWHRGEYTISTDRARLDIDVVHAFLARSYWAQGIARDVVKRAIANSRAFGLYHGATQVGFARAITDCATFAYLADVFVVEEHRGRGLGLWLVETVLAHPDVDGLPRVRLATLDAHSLYEKFGFTPLAFPERMLERIAPGMYGAPKERSQ